MKIEHLGFQIVLSILLLIMSGIITSMITDDPKDDEWKVKYHDIPPNL